MFCYLVCFPLKAEKIGSDLSVEFGNELVKKYITLGKSSETITLKDKVLNPKEIKTIDYPITVTSGEVFDGEGKLFVWLGKGKCNQDEGQPSMFIMANGSTLKNMYILNAPDGIHIKGSNVTIENIVNLKVCEDAISTPNTKRKKNITIRNSTFVDCEDKGIHLRNVGDVKIINNKFINCLRSISIRDGDDIIIQKNKATGICKEFYLKECGQNWNIKKNNHSCQSFNRIKEPKIKHFKKGLKERFETYDESRRKKVQENLRQYGYNNVIDGLWGRSTQRAIIQYIEERGACKIKGPDKKNYPRDALLSIMSYK